MNLKIEELSFIFNSLPNAVLFESSDHIIQYVNQPFCTLFGIDAPSEILIGANCKDSAVDSAGYFMEPSLFLSRIESIYANGEQVLNEVIQFKSGDTLLRDYIPYKMQGKIIGHLWLYKKATQDTNILSVANSQKHFYEDLMNNIPADIAIFDPSHRYLFVNKLAISNPELRKWIIGKDDYDYCNKSNRDKAGADNRRALFNQCVETKSTVEFEEQNIDGSGKIIYNLRRFSPVIGLQGKVEYVIGYGINVSTIKEGERRLQEHFNELRSMFNNIDQLVITLDMNGAVNFVNSQWLNVTGLDQYMLGESSLFQLIESGLENFRKTLFTVFSGYQLPPGTEKQIVITDKNGQLRTLRYYMTRFNHVKDRGQIVAVFFTDITDQIKAQKDLLETAMRERNLSEMKTNFMSMVSHELRTPLSVILSSAEILEMVYSKLTPELVEKGSVYINRIVGQVDKMTQLMNDFLFISKIESGKIKPQLEMLDIQQMLDEIKEESYNPWSDGRHLQVITKGVPKLVKFDKTMLRHILSNLLSNAFKYSSNSKIDPLIRVSFTKQYWFITVLDAGIGIEEDDLVRLGEPFVRGGNVGEIEGTGLGIMTMKFFVDHHGGLLRVRSKRNKGTMFSIRFPFDSNKILKNNE